MQPLRERLGQSGMCAEPRANPADSGVAEKKCARVLERVVKSQLSAMVDKVRNFICFFESARIVGDVVVGGYGQQHEVRRILPNLFSQG